MEGNESDTGFSSQGSSDEILEELEQKGLKRSYPEEDDNESEEKDVSNAEKRKLKKLYKPPTAEELNHLKETQNLFHSNLFRLQIEEMLKEIQIKDKRRLQFEAWFEKFQSAVSKLKDNIHSYKIIDQEWLKNFKVKIPIPQTPYNVDGNYQFKKPSAVKVIGSYASNLLIGPKFTVDILVEIPQTFFYKEDYLNCKYHRKRALYMCEFIHQLQEFPDLIESFNFISDELDSLKPGIEITPVGKLNKHVSIFLHFCPPKDTFKLNRFSPGKNNVRVKWFFNETENKTGKKLNYSRFRIEFYFLNYSLSNFFFFLITDLFPTPFYNSTILADLIIEDNMNYLKETLLMNNNIKDGILLLKIWLKQRELDNSIGCFNGFLLCMLVCYLLQIKKINVLMSSYQIFRNVCHYLSKFKTL
mgnify:CR=1 FL=1